MNRLGDRFLVEGGAPLRGTVTPAGNKNEALPVLAACLLVEAPVVIDNVPRIRDVTVLLEGLRHWAYKWTRTTGARCAWTRAA